MLLLHEGPEGLFPRASCRVWGVSSPGLQSRSGERGWLPVSVPGDSSSQACRERSSQDMVRDMNSDLFLLQVSLVRENQTPVKISLIGRSQQEAMAGPGLGHPVPESLWKPWRHKNH